jgi:hypothetical protein
MGLMSELPINPAGNLVCPVCGDEHIALGTVRVRQGNVETIVERGVDRVVEHDPLGDEYHDSSHPGAYVDVDCQCERYKHQFGLALGFVGRKTYAIPYVKVYPDPFDALKQT